MAIHFAFCNNCNFPYCDRSTKIGLGFVFVWVIVCWQFYVMTGPFNNAFVVTRCRIGVMAAEDKNFGSDSVTYSCLKELLMGAHLNSDVCYQTSLLLEHI